MECCRSPLNRQAGPEGCAKRGADAHPPCPIVSSPRRPGARRVAGRDNVGSLQLFAEHEFETALKPPRDASEHGMGWAQPTRLFSCGSGAATPLSQGGDWPHGRLQSARHLAEAEGVDHHRLTVRTPGFGFGRRLISFPWQASGESLA